MISAGSRMENTSGPKLGFWRIDLRRSSESSDFPFSILSLLYNQCPSISKYPQVIYVKDIETLYTNPLGLESNRFLRCEVYYLLNLYELIFTTSPSFSHPLLPFPFSRFFVSGFFRYFSLSIFPFPLSYPSPFICPNPSPFPTTPTPLSLFPQDVILDPFISEPSDLFYFILTPIHSSSLLCILLGFILWTHQMLVLLVSGLILFLLIL